MPLQEGEHVYLRRGYKVCRRDIREVVRIQYQLSLEVGGQEQQCSPGGGEKRTQGASMVAGLWGVCGGLWGMLVLCHPGVVCWRYLNAIERRLHFIK